MINIHPDFDPDGPAAVGSGIFGLNCDADTARVFLLPVPFDATTSYRPGTARAPQAILAASKQVDLFDRQTGRPYEAGIYLETVSDEMVRLNTAARKHAEIVIAAGGIDGGSELAAHAGEVNRASEKMNQFVYSQTKEKLAQNKIVGIIGGDHSVPFGALQAYVEQYPNLSVLHLDAHFDLRDHYEGFAWSHASIMHNVLHKTALKKLVQVGIRDFGEQEFNLAQSQPDRVSTFFDADLQTAAFSGTPWREQIDTIVGELSNEVYLSFDIDGLDPVFCPHTGTPVPGGISFNQAVALIEAVHRHHKRIVGFDLNEVVPSTDPNDEWDANVAARLLYKMIGFAVLSNRSILADPLQKLIGTAGPQNINNTDSLLEKMRGPGFKKK